MKILFFGDIMGKAGREALAAVLPKLKKKYDPDFVIANGENLAHGMGITRRTFKELMDCGVDAVTGGNHIFAKEDGINLLQDEKKPIIRPLNYPEKTAGRGFLILQSGIKRLLLINLNGRVFMKESLEDPFAGVQTLLEKYGLGEEAFDEGRERMDGILVDFHAEATSEKKAMGYFLDGRVSAVLGTHTHVQTNDDRILAEGTAYISDAGMAGVEDSVIGAEKDKIINRFLDKIDSKIKVAGEGPAEINGVFLRLDRKTGLALNIDKIRERVVKY